MKLERDKEAASENFEMSRGRFMMITEISDLHSIKGYSLWNFPGQNTGVGIPFSRASSQLRDRTQVSHIAGRFFTSWVTREAQEYWSGEPISSPGGLPHPGIEPGSPALQVDSLPTELPGKPQMYKDKQ